MLFGVGVSQEFHILSFVCFLYMSAVGINYFSWARERVICFCYCLLASIMWFLFGGFSSSSWCLGWTALFYSSTPLAFI